LSACRLQREPDRERQSELSNPLPSHVCLLCMDRVIVAAPPRFALEPDQPERI
jgi:hypothetical protein